MKLLNRLLSTFSQHFLYNPRMLRQLRLRVTVFKVLKTPTTTKISWTRDDGVGGMPCAKSRFSVGAAVNVVKKVHFLMGIL